MAHRRSPEEIDQLLEQYRASGVTQIEFCRQTGTVLSTLGRYLRQQRAPEQQLIRVSVESGSGPDARFVVVLSNGRSIESGWRFEDAELGRLIRIVESA
jgi:hypothetical protein